MKYYIRLLVLLLAVCFLTACGSAKAEPAEEQVDETEQGETTEEETIEEEETGEEAAQGGALSVGDLAPDFSVDTADGETFALKEHEGEVLLLNFWATWCGPCVGEMPAFEKLAKEYEGKANILVVNIGDDKETVDAFLEENTYTFPVGYDPEMEVFALYPSEGIPYTLIIGKDGAIKEIFLGAEGADKQYQVYKEALDTVLE